MVSRDDDVGKGGEIEIEIPYILKYLNLFLIMDVGIDQWIATVSLWICLRCNDI